MDRLPSVVSLTFACTLNCLLKAKSCCVLCVCTSPYQRSCCCIYVIYMAMPVQELLKACWCSCLSDNVWTETACTKSCTFDPDTVALITISALPIMHILAHQQRVVSFFHDGIVTHLVKLHPSDLLSIN